MTEQDYNQLHILVVDDEERITALLQSELEVEGYRVSVAMDGSSGLIALRSDPAPDLMILDWNLPDFSGLEICERMRSTGLSTPVLMLTAHDDIKDRVNALDTGVDDYLTKPFSIDELLARLRALHRRSCSKPEPQTHAESLQVADLVLNLVNHDVHRAETKIQLSNKEYQLLTFLMQSPGKVHSRQAIMRAVWGENFYGDDNLLDVYIRYLRQKIERPDLSKLIHTVRGVGFMLRSED
jgi:two-component system response regulator MprA